MQPRVVMPALTPLDNCCKNSLKRRSLSWLPRERRSRTTSEPIASSTTPSPPLEDSEILDIVDSCYRPPTSRRSAPVPSSQNLPISALHIDTDAGHRVTVLVPDGLLQRETGLGLALRNKLLERLLPLETGLGNLRMTPTRVLREAAKSNRVIILMTSDTLRIPGSLASHRHGSLTPFVGVEIENGCVLTIESTTATAGIPKLNAATLDALAEHIVDEIVA